MSLLIVISEVPEIPRPEVGKGRVRRHIVGSLAGERDSLRGSSVKLGMSQERLAWHPRKDDTHKSRSANGSLAGESVRTELGTLPLVRAWLAA